MTSDSQGLREGRANGGHLAAPWLSAMLAFDTETTGVDPHKDRIVSAAALLVGPDGVKQRHTWLLDPGIEIPAEAAKIHGITTERVRREGIPAEQAIPDISNVLRDEWATGAAVVIMNAPYDLTILSAELQRHGLPPLQIGPVLDPLVIDREGDPFRKGKRNLEALAVHYGVKPGELHSAEGDALTAARIVWAQAKRYERFAALSLTELQEAQAAAHASWAVNFEAYLQRQGKGQTIDRAWPVRQVQP